LFAGSGAGYFVDLASNLPVHHSNTRALERDLGWSGLCIEPNPRLTIGLAAQRTCVVVNAVVAQTGQGVVWRESAQAHWASGIVADGAAGAELSGDASAVTTVREAVSLVDILDANRAPRRISYLSLDVEGADEQVLASFNFSRYVFQAMTVERPSVSLKRRLQRNGYVYVLEHGRHGDELWAHESIPGGVSRAIRLAKACWRRWMAAPRHRQSGGYADDGMADAELVAAAGDTEPACPMPPTWRARR